LKAAHFAAVLDDFPRAIEVFESCAAASVNNPLLKFSVKEYLLKAGLCHLADGVRNVTRQCLFENVLS
jgi:alpha-soluble NSF attachment protein